MKADRVFRALANKHRLGILFWLQNPREHFPPQIAGDLVRDGVCGCLIAEKLHVSHPTASEDQNPVAGRPPDSRKAD